ncbi:MAG TPA: 2Fe-2S iron-sulfur cluster-binding protein [Noviherbaspirillum sp.]
MDQHFTVLLQPRGLRFDATDEATVLDAALLDGVRIPTSCRNGTCRTCMCRLVSGKVAYRIAWPGLTPEEKADNFILPCVAYPQSDLVIEAPAAVRIAEN